MCVALLRMKDLLPKSSLKMSGHSLTVSTNPPETFSTERLLSFHMYRTWNLWTSLKFCHTGQGVQTMRHCTEFTCRQLFHISHYGRTVHRSARKTVLKCLDAYHHQDLRLGLRAFCASPIQSLLIGLLTQPFWHQWLPSRFTSGSKALLEKIY